MPTMPYLAQLKEGKNLPSTGLHALLAGAFGEKHIAPKVLASLLLHAPQSYTRLLARFWMREPDGVVPALPEALFQSLWQPATPLYRGTAAENALIDRAVSASTHRRGERALIGWGTCFSMLIDSLCQVPQSADLLDTPIMILGAGASGIIAARLLRDLGFRQMTILDQDGGYGGIWTLPVMQRQRTNAFTLRYQGPRFSASVPPAPGSGQAVTRFLAQVVAGDGDALPPVLQGQVRGVKAGDLAHTIVVRDGNGEYRLHTPILINALGVGIPRPISCVIPTDAEQQVGHRWPDLLTDEQVQLWKGKRMVFVGLSQQTLFMLHQVQRAIDLGADLSYTVLTSHHEEHLAAPHRSGLQRDRLHDLSGLALDLPEARTAFARAREGRGEREQVLSAVAFWTVQAVEDGSRRLRIHHERQYRTLQGDLACLYGLVGYGHSQPMLNQMSIGGEPDGRALLDVDGEVQAASHIRRLHRGYFALGPVAGQPNGASLPGIFYRVGEMLPTLIARAAEYAAQRS